MNEINVEKIMEEIRADIKKRNLSEEDLNFLDVKKESVLEGVFNHGHMQDELKIANQFADVNPHQSIGGSGIKRFIKRVIRKCIAFYVQPLFIKQNEFNAHSVRALNEMNLYIERSEARQKELESMLEKLQKEVTELQSRS